MEDPGSIPGRGTHLTIFFICAPRALRAYDLIHMPPPPPQRSTQHIPPVYVFDLDDVLMPTNALFALPRVRAMLQALNRGDVSQTHAVYRQFVSHDPLLVHRLGALNGERYLLTNGSQSHAEAATQALGVYPYLRNIVHAQSGCGLKPDPGPYTRIEALLRHHYAGDVSLHEPITLPPIVFFDDRLENLVYPKRRGWTTVWIPSAHEYHQLHQGGFRAPPYADFVFPTVYVALEYFLMVQRQYSLGDSHQA